MSLLKLQFNKVLLLKNILKNLKIGKYNERKNPFPDNVKKTAEVNNVKLLTTVELFEIIKNVIDGKLDKEEAINKILE